MGIEGYQFLAGVLNTSQVKASGALMQGKNCDGAGFIIVKGFVNISILFLVNTMNIMEIPNISYDPCSVESPSLGQLRRTGVFPQEDTGAESVKPICSMAKDPGQCCYHSRFIATSPRFCAAIPEVF